MNKIIFPLKRRKRGASVGDLQDALQLFLDGGILLAGDEVARRELSEALQRERADQTFRGATNTLVARFQEERGLQPTGEVDESTADAINVLLNELEGGRPKAAYHVIGRVVSRVSASTDGLRVVLVDKSVGGDIPLAEAITSSRGYYEASFSQAGVRGRGKEKPDLQARVYSGERFLAASDVRYDASPREKNLNVLLSESASTALRSEHETLNAALSIHYKGNLRELQETDERQDITYLANKTGWDARAVALAALADQFSARTIDANGSTAIAQPFFYALFRAGLPANEAAIFRTDTGTVEAIWKQAVKQGVIPEALREYMPAALERFQQLAARQLLEGAPLAGASSFKEILALSLGDDVQKQCQVADLYTRHTNDLPAFWRAIEGAFGDAAAKQLRLDGQLAYLTLNNAALIRKLRAAAGQDGLTDTSQLTALGFYRAAKWREAVGDDSVPPEIPGKDDIVRRDRYADLLAAQVRLSFPTEVLAQMVKSGDTTLAADNQRDQVHTFLMEHREKFEIGMQPVEQYVKRNNLQVAPEVIKEVTRIQRVYQITPDDEAMNGLLEKGVDSAYAAVRYARDEFIRAFKDAVGGEQNARLIHAKAQQVHAAVLNITLTFLTAKGAPGIGVQSQASIADRMPSPQANTADVLAYATLESLFGEMDYCTCEHCRSVLSPAAYLVDLLQFIDRPPTEVPAGYTNPVEVLLERRPDIQHLPLTCENTNTPLPYLDLVNETLEYYVANGLSLADTHPDPDVNSEYTGHNTDGSVKPEELLANPQFVNESAYTALAVEHFPHPLPFHQPLENLRRAFRRFEAPLPEMMEALRQDDSLERASEDEYGWRDIWMETLGLSRAEHALLTERWLSAGATDVMLTVKQLYGFDAATADADVRAVLDNAKTFSRRVGVTYEELAEILKTRFINPSSYLIPRLERLGVSFASLEAFKSNAISYGEFDALLAPDLDPAQYGGDIKAWVRNDDNYGRIMSLLTLAGPSNQENVCSFDQVELRYANPATSSNALRPFEFVRLIRFIRLWKKLGWSIEQTDKALTALYPAGQTADDPSDLVNVERLDAGFREMLPRLGVVRRVIDLLKLALEKDLFSLLACFAPIDTHGESSLYRKMFLSPSQLDTAFADDGYGNYLTDTEEKLLDHVETLRAAFSLAASEFSEITVALGYDGNTPLTLDNISTIFRYGWLARKLKLSVRETLLLSQYTGYDPFDALNPVGPAMLRFIQLIDRLRTLGIKPIQALYLIWNDDLSGKSAPAETEITAFARTVRAALMAIEGEFAVSDDPDGSIARARMALVYGNTASEFFFGLLENTFATAVAYGHGHATLEPAILDAAPGRIAYDDFRKRLSFTGVLTTATRDALAAVAGVTQPFKDAVNSLYLENQKVIGPFFGRYPELLPLHDGYVSSAEPAEAKREALLEAFLPELKRRRKSQQALQSVSAAGGIDIGLASGLLENANVLHAFGVVDQPALDDLTALETAGLAARFFYAASVTGNPDLTRSTETLEYAATATNTLPLNAVTAGAAISGVWSGYLEAPENGFYNIRIVTDTDAAVSLTLDGSTVPLAQSSGIWENTAPIDLRAGTLYAVSIAVENVKNNLAVHWQTEGRGWEIIPGAYLYSATLVDHLSQAYTRLLKSAALAGALKLTAAEFVYFATDASYHIGGEGWLNHLPVTGVPDGATAATLLKAFDALIDFSRVKAAISPSDERLLEVLRDPVAATLEATSLLYLLAQWEKDSLNALLARFGKVAADLRHVETLRQIYDAYTWVTKLGIPAPTLIAVTTNEPSAATVRDLQAALRARYDESSWLDVLRPINDEMRSMQRDALVAFTLHRLSSNPASAHIDTTEKLFEYFLMDVQMDACMLTSRIRHALSSVQLFVERCLMNLEPRVSPASIQAAQWEWMKRYRVWEANRKVFLYPENWLEPELRDDQSPFFKEVMSELLQGDITQDRAAQSLVGYLTKLEEVAKLETCAVHYVENEPGTADDIAHVIARTAGANRKYFYRRREYGYWTPWEKLSLDIEDNPVLPVVWKNRLFLFWLKFIQQTQQNIPSTPTAGSLAEIDPSEAFPNETPKLVVKALLSWSEFLGGKWQPSRTSDPATPLELAGGLEPDQVSGFRSDLRLAALFWPSGTDPEGALRVIVSYKGWQGSSFFLHNSFSTPELRESNKQAHFSPKRSFDTAAASLKIAYSGTRTVHAVVDNSIADRTVGPHHSLESNAWEAPFFYEDSRHAFYVTTAERLVLVPKWNDFGIVTNTAKSAYEIPKLALRPDTSVMGSPIPHIRQPGFGVLDPSLIERYVTQDAYIGTAIGTPGTVAYGDKHIGPSGSQSKTAEPAN